jgi:hypothetical protein
VGSGFPGTVFAQWCLALAGATAPLYGAQAGALGEIAVGVDMRVDERDIEGLDNAVKKYFS